MEATCWGLWLCTGNGQRLGGGLAWLSQSKAALRRFGVAMAQGSPPSHLSACLCCAVRCSLCVPGLVTETEKALGGWPSLSLLAAASVWDGIAALAELPLAGFRSCAAFKEGLPRPARQIEWLLGVCQGQRGR